ncbi:MAG: apolipoprotein N-acyltransferase [Gammaproteobacteria bacterium]|nr:apolipoprotein N-acyltransferase [Gammaproteobacteria bacterium]
MPLPDSLRLRAVLALGAGLLTPCAFAPYDLWPLALITPAALLCLLDGLAPRRAAALGYAFGLGLFGHGVWWIQVSVHQFGVPYYAFSVSMTALFVAGMALYPALFAALLASPGARDRRYALVAAAPLWVLVEALRGWFLTGFPWLSLGYSQLDSPLAGYAPLLGEPGVSLAVMIGASALVAVVGGRRRALAALVLLAVFALGQGLRGIEYTRVVDAGLEAALIQGAVAQSIKWDPEQRARSIERYVALSEPHWGVDVILWPETAIAAFPYEVEELLAALAGRARASGTTLLVGMPTGEPWNGAYYNSLVALGAHEDRYDKRHLVPFGEFFPLQSVVGGLARLLHIPMSDFSAGAATRATIRVGDRVAGASICYEDAFGREVISALPEAAFLVNVSNDAWFGDTIAPHQHLEMARMRALESGRYLLRGTNTGITAVIDHHGAVVARAPQFEPAALTASFDARAGATPYARLGDGPLLGGLLAVVALSAWWRQRGVPGDAG